MRFQSHLLRSEKLSKQLVLLTGKTAWNRRNRPDSEPSESGNHSYIRLELSCQAPGSYWEDSGVKQGLGGRPMIALEAVEAHSDRRG
jgi:hypothetical protein